jgi:hypothetical protein
MTCKQRWSGRQVTRFLNGKFGKIPVFESKSQKLELKTPQASDQFFCFESGKSIDVFLKSASSIK